MKNLREELKFFRQQFAWLLKYEGPSMALLRSFARVLRILGLDIREKPWFPQAMEGRFDRAIGVDTSAFVITDGLDLEPAQKEQARRYMPTSAPQFCKVISSLNIPRPEFTFIDFGSGKGKTLLLASELGFGNIIGVELSKPLHEIALENIEKFHSLNKNLTKPVSVNEDAAQFLIPAEPAVIFFYNPFYREIMNLVLSNIERSLHDNPRALFVVYNNPIDRDLFDKSLFFQPPKSDFNGRWLSYAASNASSEND